MAPVNVLASSSNAGEIERTLELLKEGKEKIQLNERHRNVTLVLGITGAGKSTFVQWLAGDNTKLISEKVPGSFNDFIIKDETRISNSTIQSMTIFPELVVDRESGNAYYDCPGFSDTRSTSNDIAGTYFVKSVADYVENVRLLFVIGYPAVRIGVDRRQFIELLKHSTSLVRNVDKFRKSIALVVTKVDNTPYTVDTDGKMVYIPDENIIESIAQFLINIKEDLKLDSAKTNENIIEFTDVLLQKDGQNYSRIAIFRRPDKEGPLSQIPLLQNGKVKIVEMVKQLELTPIEENDFGYSISDSSKNSVHELANILNDRVWQDADTIVKFVTSSYQQTVDEIRSKINSFVTAIFTVDSNLVEAQAYAAKLKVADRIASELSVLSVTTKVLSDKLNYTLTTLEIDTLNENAERILLGANHLEFLQNVTDSTLEAKPWESLLKGIADSLITSKRSIQGEINASAEKLVTSVQSTIDGLANDLWKSKLNQMQSLDIQRLPAQLERQLATMRNLTEQHPTSIEQLAITISKNVESLGLETSLIKRNIITLFNSEKYLNYLQAISDRQLDAWSPEWMNPLEQTFNLFSNSLDWYQFLNGLYSKLSEYEFQQDPSRYNVANLEDWGAVQSKPQGIQIDEKNFDQFLNQLNQYNISGLDTLRGTRIAKWQLNELNQLLRLTVKHGEAKSDCSEGKLVVTGDYVKLSKLKQKLVDMCPNSPISIVNIFASNTVFIDSDLNGVGDKLKFTLIAPKFEVVGKKRINLDGSPGRKHEPSNASDAKKRGDSVEHGKPGFPGGPAGSFICAAQQFINRDDLTITANGGVGGAGQNGGAGPPGEDGKDSQVPTSDCKINDPHKQIEHNVVYPSGLFTPGSTHYYTYYVYGTEGKEGERGGDGGAAGIGGNPGHIQLNNLEKSTQLRIKTNQGEAGKDGFGGNGGSHGIHGRDMKAKCKTIVDVWSRTKIFLGTEYISYKSSGLAEPGTAGGNRQNVPQPEPVSMIEHPADAINEYKRYLRSNLNGVNGRFKRNTTIALLDQLDEQARDVYDSLALAGELEDLEELSPTQKNKHDSIHYYKSLSSRINTYVQSPKPSERSLQYKKVLNYLSAATLGKLYNLKAGEETNLIIDVEGYLNYVQENMNTLNDIRQKHNEHEIVQQHKQKYHDNIEQQIKEDKDFIEKQIKPEFDIIGKEIDAKIDKLIEDTEKLEKEAEDKKKELEEKREKLQKQFVGRGIFSFLSIASQVVSCIGPIGAAIGTVVGGASSITEGFVLDDQTGAGKEFKLPAGIKDNIKLAETEFKTFFAGPIEDLKAKLSAMAKEIQNEPKLNDLAKQLDSISKRVPSLEGNPPEANLTSALKELEEEAKSAVKAKMDKMKKDGQKWPDRSVKAINYANKICQMGSVTGCLF